MLYRQKNNTSLKTFFCLSLVYNKNIIRFFPGSSMRNLFTKVLNKSHGTYHKAPLRYINDTLSSVEQKELRAIYQLQHLKKPLDMISIQENSIFLLPKSNVMKFLPLPNISGLFIPPKEFEQLDVDITNNIQGQIMVKLVSMLGNPLELKTSTDVAAFIEELMKPDTYTSNPYYYPLLQHNLCLLFQHTKFNPKILYMITNNMVDYSEFNTPVSVLTIIEALVVKYTTLSMIEQYKHIIILKAQNPDNPLSESHLERHKNLCYKQMKQIHGDFRMEAKNIENIMVELLKFFDVKLISNPLKKIPMLAGHLSCTSHFTDYDKQQYLKRICGDVLQKSKHETEGTLKYSLLQNLFTDLSIVEQNKQMSIDTKMIMCNTIQDQFNLNANITNLVCSKIVMLPQSTLFTELFGDIVLQNPLFERQLITAMEHMNLNKIISPKTSIEERTKVFNITLHKFISTLPPKQKENALENLKQIKQIKNNDDDLD